MTIRFFLVFIITFLGGSACAQSGCDDIHGQQSHLPLKTKGGVICFIQEPVVDSKGIPVGTEAIFLYYVSDEGISRKAEAAGLLYDDTPGEIVDAFSSNIDRDHPQRVFVIHSVDVRTSLSEPDSSGKFYSISVFDLSQNVLRRDDRASDWFGAQYSRLSDERAYIDFRTNPGSMSCKHLILIFHR